MAINQNHLFEDLNGVKCAIVEKNVTKERADFLKKILDYNRYTVIIVASPPLKAIPIKPVTGSVPGAATTTEAVAAAPVVTPEVPAPETFTIGVTDVTFNAINAIFGRLLKTPGRHIVTLAYWQQKENVPEDDIPYFDNKNK